MSHQFVKSFQYIDYLLFLIACKIFPTNKCATILNVFVKLSSLGLISASVYYSALQFSLKKILINIVGMSSFISTLSMLIIITLKRVDLINLIVISNNHLRLIEQNRLRRSSIVIILLSLIPIVYLIIMVAYCLIEIIDPKLSSLQVTALLRFQILFSSLPVFPISIALYVHVFYMVQLVEVNFYSSHNNENGALLTSHQMFNILIKRRYITDNVKSKFNESLNGLPFVWFTHFFCSFSGLIKSMGTLEQNENRFIIAQAIFLLTLIAYVAAFLVFSHSMNRKLIQMSDQLIGKVIRSSPDPNRLLLINELKGDCGIQLNSWDMFPLNKGFLLTFLSSLITFSVLFIELSKRFEG